MVSLPQKNFLFYKNNSYMTKEELKKIISQGEGSTVEFKSSQEGLARSVYETICAFLNRRGGHFILGVSDEGKIIGINPDKIQEQSHLYMY